MEGVAVAAPGELRVTGPATAKLRSPAASAISGTGIGSQLFPWGALEPITGPSETLRDDKLGT